MIKLIVGLGNPGREYELTRHNAGFWLLDQLAVKLGAPWKSETKFFAEITKVTLAGAEVYLLKPQTYMNLSAKAIHAVASFYKIKLAQILVCHDELDFACGVARLKFGGGAGGHNGLKDIERILGKDYWRLRLGIGHPGAAAKVVQYVLQPPTIDERIAIELGLGKSLTVIDLLVQGQFTAAQKCLHSN
jgi:PTH1 family peptidyl-tRNA hydrolase